jgi:isopentenyldiphosphate isomerase
MIEWLDCLDEQGVKVGLSRPRGEVHALGIWHRAVHIWFLSSDQRLLLQKRSYLCTSYPGFWDISCAGHVSAGETVMQAAKKELQEELGLSVCPSELELLFDISMTSIQNKGTYIEKEIQSVFLFRAKGFLEGISLSEEVLAIQWVPVSYFKEHYRCMISTGILVDHAEEYERLLLALDV